METYATKYAEICLKGQKHNNVYYILPITQPPYDIWRLCYWYLGAWSLSLSLCD